MPPEVTCDACSTNPGGLPPGPPLALRGPSRGVLRRRLPRDAFRGTPSAGRIHNKQTAHSTQQARKAGNKHTQHRHHKQHTPQINTASKHNRAHRTTQPTTGTTPHTASKHNNHKHFLERRPTPSVQLVNSLEAYMGYICGDNNQC